VSGKESKMENKLAAKVTELKYAKADRRILCGGSKAHKEALREYNRAARRAAKAACREALKEAA
jgi:hypothetical protein